MYVCMYVCIHVCVYFYRYKVIWSTIKLFYTVKNTLSAYQLCRDPNSLILCHVKLW